MTLFGLLAKRLRWSVMRDIKATVRLQRGGWSGVRNVEYRLRIDLPKVKSSRHNGAKRVYDS